MAKPSEISIFNESDVKYAELLLSNRPKNVSRDLERPTRVENNDYGKIKINKENPVKRLIKKISR